MLVVLIQVKLPVEAIVTVGGTVVWLTAVLADAVQLVAVSVIVTVNVPGVVILVVAFVPPLLQA